MGNEKPTNQKSTETVHHHRITYAGALCLAVLGLFLTPLVFYALQARHSYYVVLTSPIHVALAALLVAATFGLLIWFVQKRKIVGSLLTLATLAPVVYLAGTEPVRATTAFLLGMAIPAVFICWKMYRTKQRNKLMLLWILCAWPMISAVGILLTAPHTFSVLHVSKEIAAPGETVSVTVTGLFGIPAGQMTVYLFPVDHPMAEEGYEPPYFIAESDHRVTAGHSLVRFPVFVHTASITAGNQEWECRGGDICSGSEGPGEGEFRVAVGVPNPFYSWNTILVMGPLIRISETQAQRDAMLFEDEANFLYEQLCSEIHERKSSPWDFMVESIPCGGFLGARAAADPETPVWNTKRNRVDDRPPLSVEEGQLCLNNTARPPYSGQAKVCMPYAGDPNMPLPESSTVRIDLEWSGSNFIVITTQAKKTLQEEVRKNAKILFPETYQSKDAEIHNVYVPEWREIDGKHMTVFQHTASPRTWVTAIVDPTSTVCLFSYGRKAFEDAMPEFVVPENWKDCTVLLQEPTKAMYQ